MTVSRNVYSHRNGYEVVVNGQYVGFYKTQEEAERERDLFIDKLPVRTSYRYTVEGFTDRLNEAIWKSGLSNSEIIRKTNLSAGALWNYRNGATPNISALARLSVALNVSADWLLGLEK